MRERERDFNSLHEKTKAERENNEKEKSSER